MNLADHLRPLLRDHDCVIIPDFGGLVAEYTPARVQPGGRHILSPPTRQVAFNQALTRNDGLLVDALCQLGLPTAEAREAVRVAVAALHQELQAQQRTELPGIGVFRQLAGRGLQFEYTGTDNLLAAAFGLPELTAHPVRATDVRLAREQQAQLVPRLRSAGRGLRWRRLLPGASIGLLAGLAVAGLYLLNLHPTALPTAWQSYLPRWEQGARMAAPQQAALAQPSLNAAPTASPSPVSVSPVAIEAVSPEEASAQTASYEASSPSSEAASTVAASPAPVAITRSVPVAVASPAVVPAQPVAARAVASEMASLETISPKATSLETEPVVASLPQRLVGQTAGPTEMLLSQPARFRKKGKIPAAAIPAVADESNVARPIPMAMRLAGNTAAKAPVAPKASVVKTAATPHAAAPAASAAIVAHAPAKPATRPLVHTYAGKTVTVVAAKPVVTKAAVVTKAPVATPVVAKAAALPAVAPAAPAMSATSTTIKGRTGRYYVVVAAYGSLARAEQGRRNLEHAGRPAKVILPPAGSRLYRLSAADFADRPTAALAATHLRQNPHFDKGLTIYPY
jgi:hypothetical protein